MESGTDFHTVVKEALMEMQQTGSMPLLNDDYVQKLHKSGRVKHLDQVLPFVRTMRPVLECLRPSASTRVEESVMHNGLFYGGRIDAILEWE